MSFISISITNFSNFNNKQYKTELARRRAEVETLLQQQKEKKQLEHQAWKEAKIAKWKRLEEEVWKKQEEEELQWREEEC